MDKFKLINYFALLLLVFWNTYLPFVHAVNHTATIYPSKFNTIHQRADTNINKAGKYYITCTSVSPYFNRNLFALDISENTPPGAKIQNQVLLLYHAATSDNVDPPSLEMYKFLGTWGESSSNAGTQYAPGASAKKHDAKWSKSFNTGNSRFSLGSDFTQERSEVISVNGIGHYSWSSARLLYDVHQWTKNPSQNARWSLKNNELASFQAKRLDSMENSETERRPAITVTSTRSAELPFAETSQWTWMNGTTSISAFGFYGNQGIESPQNIPGGRTGSIGWRDNMDNFWLYGGLGYSSNTFGILDDLWKYNTVTRLWSWIKGSSSTNQAAIYGTQGVPSFTNSPGSRAESISWIEDNGKFWLFGGANSGGLFNDLWKYDPLTNIWTWISGSSIANEFGSYLINPIPGSRIGSVSWKDGFGNFWLFGGYGKSSSAEGYLNDLWKYEPGLNKWTFVNGDSLPNALGIYTGTDSEKKPGARSNASGWFDSNGNLWLFGGEGYAESTNGYLNDLWKYDIASNKWTWVRGSKMVNEVGSYGSIGISSPENTPGARKYSYTWIDSLNNLWLFGGSYLSGSGKSNDLWKFDNAIKQWIWIKGSQMNLQQVYGNYGELGIPFNTNTPGARYSGIHWTDSKGNFWLYSGNGFSLNNNDGWLQDLWRFKPGPLNQPPIITISSPINNTIYSSGKNIILNAEATDADGTVRRVEFFDNGIKFLIDSIAPFGLSSSEVEPGNYKLTAKAFDNVGDSTVSDTVSITIINCASDGFITGEGYTNISGTQVTDMTGHPSYPGNPSITAQLNALEYANVGENYGGRLTGYICAPLSGNYTFYIAGDDQAGLFLSTDDNPSNKILIAYNLYPVGFRSWTTTATQKSSPIKLIKGARYYIETLHKQSVNSNHLSVRWTLPNGVSEAPIPGNRLSPFLTSSLPLSQKGFSDFITNVDNITLNSAFDVKVSPNPSREQFNFKLNLKPGEKLLILISDLQGRIIEKKEIKMTNQTITLGKKLSPGIYIAEFRANNYTKILRLVKQ